MDALSDDTKRWTTNDVLLEAERQKAHAESSALRRKPPPPPNAGVSGAHPIKALSAPRPGFSQEGPRTMRDAQTLLRESQPSTRPSMPVPVASYVDPMRVRALYDQYIRVMGPIAKAVFESELRAIRRLPSTLSDRDCDFLVERLTARIPVASARARFLAAVHDVFA
jgi:hypothetical protein